MSAQRKWMIVGSLMLTFGIVVAAVSAVERPHEQTQYIYDVIVIDAPPPKALTDNRNNNARLAAELAAYLNAESANGWTPSHMWGTGPVFVVLKRPKL